MPTNGAASSPAALPEGYSDLLKALNRLSGVLSHVGTPVYDYSPPITFGGASGSFQLNPFFDGPAEWTLVSVAANDVTSGAIGYNNDGAPSATTVYDPSVFKPIIPIVAAGAGTVQGVSAWFPCDRFAPLYLNLTVANSKTAWATVQFRRRQNTIGVVAQG